MSLAIDIMNKQMSQDVIVNHRNSLQTEYQVISDLAPQTGTKEYAEAQKRLHTAGASGEEHYTWSDAEINQFLPENLRLTNI